MLIDTHAHLDDERFDNDRALVIENARKNGICNIINVGYNEKTILSTIDLINNNDFIFGAIGWHPNNAHQIKESDYQWIEELVSNNSKILAIGEIGLDYYHDYAPKEIQQEVFVKQIRIAKRLGVPIIIHNRDAHQDVMNILKEEKADEIGGIMHSYSGSLEMALEYIKLNFYISFSGPITFKNAKNPKNVATNIPLDKILVETDSPYLTPEPHRGKRNEPVYVKYVSDEIARLRNLDIAEVNKITTQNAKKIFKI